MHREKQHQPGENTVETREIDRYRSVYYAAASGDFNPIHIDNEMGQMAGMGGVILQGLCTLAMGVETAVNHFGGDPGAIKRVKVRFSRPVRPEDTLQFTVSTVAVENGRVKCRLEAVNQNGETVLGKGEIEGEDGSWR